MGRVNIVKQIKVDGKWILRSIPKKKSGHYDWAALPDGDYFVEWREDGRRRRQPAGNTAAQAMEEQRRKRHELEAHALGFAPRIGTSDVSAAEPPTIRKLIDRYLDQIKTLKKPNTHRKYDAVLARFAKVFDRRTLDSISTEELNDYVVALMKSGMSANTVLHNVVIIAQFCKRNGRPGLTRLLHLPERISPLPLEYTEEELHLFSKSPPIARGSFSPPFCSPGSVSRKSPFSSGATSILSSERLGSPRRPISGFHPSAEKREKFRSLSNWPGCLKNARTSTASGSCSLHRRAIGNTTCCSNAKLWRSAQG
jgi:hypothetical protein